MHGTGTIRGRTNLRRDETLFKRSIAVLLWPYPQPLLRIGTATATSRVRRTPNPPVTFGMFTYGGPLGHQPAAVVYDLAMRVAPKKPGTML
jgi:hypothetical protein